jgi:hypothetical protein
MPFNNAINAPLPISGANGGTGVSSPTAHGILIAEGATAMNTLVLTNGQVVIGITGSDPVGATLTGGTGISVNSAAGAITINAIGSGAFGWVVVSTTSQAMTSNNGYIASNSSLVTLTLPVTAAVGDEISIAGSGAGGWLIAQNAGQTIHFGTSNTTTGATGSLASTNRYDQVDLLCIVANTDFVVRGVDGNLTVV